MSRKNTTNDIYVDIWKKTKNFSGNKKLESIENEIKKEEDFTRKRPSYTSSKLSIKPVSNLDFDNTTTTPLISEIQENNLTNAFGEPSTKDSNQIRETVIVKHTEEDKAFIRELQAKNRKLVLTNEDLRKEVEKSLELLNKMDVSFKQNVRQKEKALQDKRFYASEYQKLQSRLEELKATHQQSLEENEMLREDREEKVHQIRNIELEVDDLESLNRELKEKLRKYKEASKNVEEREILTSQSVLEAERLRKENDDLKFTIGQLKERLALQKVGIDASAEEMEYVNYDEKLLAEITALENHIQKLEEKLEIKDIEHGAKLQIYKKALIQKGDSEDILKMEELKMELQEDKKHLREQELVIEELESKIKNLSQDATQTTDMSSSKLSKRIVKLETLLSERDFKIKNLTSTVDKLENQLTETIEKVALLEEELINLPENSSESEVDIEQLNVIVEKISRMKTPKSKLEKKLDEYGTKLKDLHRENGLLNAQLEHLYSKLGDLEEFKS